MATYEDFERQALEEGMNKVFSEVVGHSIVSVEKNSTHKWDDTYRLTLDDGRKFLFKSVSDCCAYGAIDEISVHGAAVSNIITDVKRVKRKGSDEYESAERWFFLADMEETINASNKLMTIDVSAGAGSGCYTFGFEIEIID